MIIGVTGSSGAGKSTVCEILEEKYQIKVLNADKITRQLSKKGNNYLTDIVSLFGKEILQEDEELDRKKLADIIYHNEKKRNKLNECTFRHIYVELDKKIQEIHKKDKNAVIAIDAPLLFEAKIEEICDIVIAVVAKDKKLQIDRIVQRDFITKEQAADRLQVQKPDDFYTSRSKYTIINNEKIEEIEQQIEKIINKILK